MRWQGSRRSSNVQDYRGRRFGGGAGLGIGGTLIALAAAYFLGVDPRVILGLTEARSRLARSRQVQSGTPTDEAGQFMAAVLGETEDTWGAIFQAERRRRTRRRRSCSSRTRSAPAAASPARRSGRSTARPISKVYIDLDFYNELATRFQAPGDFAQAYVLAHEVGHHVQTLLGTADKVRGAQQGASEVEANQLQVRMELQADCYAGVWAHNADRDAADPRAGRRRGSAAGRLSRGRRHDPEAHAGARGAGLLHARLRRAAHELVPARPEGSAIRQACDTSALASPDPDALLRRQIERVARLARRTPRTRRPCSARRRSRGTAAGCADRSSPDCAGAARDRACARPAPRTGRSADRRVSPSSTGACLPFSDR